MATHFESQHVLCNTIDCVDAELHIGTNSKIHPNGVVLGQPASTVSVRGSLECAQTITINSNTPDAYELPTSSGGENQVLASNGHGGTDWVSLSPIVNPFDQNLNTTDNVAFNGVQVAGAYTLPTSAGTANQVVTANGSGGSSWTTPAPSNPFDQSLNTTDNVAFNGVQVAGAYTLPTSAGTANQVVTANGSGGSTWTTPVALNPFDQSLNTTDNVAFNGVQVAGAYTLPTSAGSANQVVTANGSGGSTWTTPVALNPFDQLLNTTDNVAFNGVQVAGVYTLPTSAGSANQVVTANGSGGSAWTTLVPLNPFNQSLNTTNNVAFNSVQVAGVYTLPTSAGVANQVVTSNGSGGSTWATPVPLNPFNQSLNTTNNVAFNSVQVAGAYTLPTSAGATNQVVTANGSGGSTWTTPIPLNPFDQSLNTTNNVAFNNVQIAGAYTLPNSIGPTDRVLTSNGLGGTVWSVPAQIKAPDSSCNVTCNTSGIIQASVNGGANQVFAVNGSLGPFGVTSVAAPDNTSTLSCKNSGVTNISIGGSNSVFHTSTAEQQTYIQAPDGNATMVCQGSGRSIIYNNSAGAVFVSDQPSGKTRLLSPGVVSSALELADVGPSTFVSTGDIVLQPGPGHFVVISGYILPPTIGPLNSVLTTGLGGLVWQAPPGFTQSFGGAVVANDFFPLNGLFTSPGVSPSVPPPQGCRFVAPVGCSLTRISFDANSTSPTSINIYQNNSLSQALPGFIGTGQITLASKVPLLPTGYIALQFASTGSDLTNAIITCYFDYS